METIKPKTAEQVLGAAADAAGKLVKGAEEVAANGVDAERTALHGKIGDFPRPVIAKPEAAIKQSYEGSPVSISNKPELLESPSGPVYAQNRGIGAPPDDFSGTKGPNWGYDAPRFNPPGDHVKPEWQSRMSKIDLTEELDIPADATPEQIQAALKSLEEKYASGPKIIKKLDSLMPKNEK